MLAGVVQVLTPQIWSGLGNFRGVFSILRKKDFWE